MALPLSDYLPFWSRLTPDEQQSLAQNTTLHEIKKGTILHNGNEDCVGLLVVTQGQLRAFTRSAEGKEMTLYRLFERDICLFSASCILNSIVFDLSVSAEQDSTLYRIPSDLYRAMMQQSPAIANFTNELMAQRFSDVMWLFDQVMTSGWIPVWRRFSRKRASSPAGRNSKSPMTSWRGTLAPPGRL